MTNDQTTLGLKQGPARKIKNVQQVRNFGTIGAKAGS